MKYPLIFYIHILVILFLWASPFIFNYKIILTGIALYYLQLLIFKDCILTKKQFRTKHREMTMYTFILEELGIKVNRKMMVILADFVFPWIILAISLILRFVFNYQPLIF